MHNARAPKGSAAYSDLSAAQWKTHNSHSSSLSAPGSDAHAPDSKWKDRTSNFPDLVAL